MQHEHAFLLILGVQPLPLFQEGHHTAKGEDSRTQDQGSNKADSHIANDERDDGTACCSRSPVDVATLKTQEFKRPLKPLENLVIEMFCTSHHSPPMPKNRGRA